MLPATALREMEGSVAEAMATPNNPSGSCMKRKAYWSQPTGPFTPRTGSTMVVAKLVLTSTFTCTAALPMMAGPIRRMMRRNPGCDQSMARLETEAGAPQAGNCQRSCTSPPSTTP